MSNGIVRVVLGGFRLDFRTRRLIFVVSFFILVMLAGLFVFNTLSLLWNEKEELRGVLTRLATMVETMDIPIARDVWRLPYFYNAADARLRETSTEKSTEDWADLHKQEELQLVCLGTDSACPSRSWLDNTFGATQSTHYGISYIFTPVEAKTIYFVDHGPRRNVSFSQLPTIRLWFARDVDEAIYILSHIKNTTEPDQLALRLKVHFNQAKEVFGTREFRIQTQEDETISIEGPPDDSFVAKPAVTGWRSESDWYFKLVS